MKIRYSPAAVRSDESPLSLIAEAGKATVCDACGWEGRAGRKNSESEDLAWEETVNSKAFLVRG